MHDPLNEPKPFPILTIVLGLLMAIMGFALVAVTKELRDTRADITALRTTQTFTP